MAEDEQQHNDNAIDSENNDNSTSEDESETLEIESSTTKTTDYEKQRQSRIAANNARMESLGLRRIANSIMGTPQISKVTQNSSRKSKRAVKKNDDDDEYEPNCDDDNGGRSNSNSDDDEDDYEEEEETFVRRNRKSSAKKVKNVEGKTGKHVSIINHADISFCMDEDEALKQAIALSLKDTGEISGLQHGGSSQNLNTPATRRNKKKSDDQFQEDNSKMRKRKLFTSRVQMSEDDLVIHFCQIDEVGKGSITVRDVRRMAATHDFTWTSEEISDMIRCFDSDCDGKLILDDFRNIAQRCNMLQTQQDS